MDSHAIREENSLLRTRIAQCEEKMRLLADALEARNTQMKDLVNMYNQLQDEFREAQEAANAAANLLNERDGIIEHYSQLIAKLKNDLLTQARSNAQEAGNLRDGLTNERLHFIDTLNRLSQAKAPAEEAFREMEGLLDRRGKEYADLLKNFEDLSAKFAAVNEASENREAEFQRLLREKAALEQENIRLRQQLVEARSGRKELAEIEQLKRTMEGMRQKMHEAIRAKTLLKRKLKAVIAELQKLREGAGQDETVSMLQDKILDLEARIREINAKNDDLRAKATKASKNEMEMSRKLAQVEQNNRLLEEQILILKEQNSKLNQQKSKDASARMKEIRSIDQIKAKMAAYKKRAQEEIAKRIGAEEAVYNHKEEIFGLKKENALLKDQLSDQRGSDVEPLVQLLRELRLEAINMDDEYRKLVESVPPVRPILEEEVPKGICESAAASIARILAKNAETEVENRELRVLVSRFAKSASVYHRIAEVIQQYPILSADDIGQEEPYGNWVLPVDVEHLQRTVIKLHEILSKRTAK